MLTRRDKDLVAGDLVGAIGLWFCLGAQQAQVGAAVGLCQAHGARPLTAGQLGQVLGLQFIRAVCVQGFIRAVRQAGVHGPGLVGAVEHFVQGRVHHKRQALAAVGRVAGQCRPASFHKLLIGLLEALGRGHLVGGGVQLAAFFVTADVQREHHIGRELACFLEHGVDGVGIHLRVLGHGLVFLFNAKHFVQQELHVAQRWVIARHGWSPNESAITTESGLRLGGGCAVAQQNVFKARQCALQGTGAAQKARLVVQHQTQAVNFRKNLVLVCIGL